MRASQRIAGQINIKATGQADIVKSVQEKGADAAIKAGRSYSLGAPNTHNSSDPTGGIAK